MTDPQSSLHGATLREFKEVLKSCTVDALCGRSYIRVTRLIKWLESDAQPGISQVEILLDYAYRNRRSPAPPLRADDVCKGEESCALVFSILLELGHGELIDQFENRGLCDKRLPIPLSDLKDLKDRGFQYAEEFNKKQWAFCPANFDYHSRNYHGDRIIPICKREEISDKGGTARLWQIAVQEEFIKESLKERVPNSKFLDDTFGWCYQFALKTFREGNGASFKNERDAFKALRRHEGMVRYLGDYEHIERVEPITDGTERRGSTSGTKMHATYNILLEYGELDLDRYFEDCLPPILEGEVADFWKDMFDVADAVKGIHELTISTGGMRQEYYGWHADIKPDNILIVKGKFKLADPGFARFEKKSSRDSTIVPGGTTTYGAPECHPSRDPRTPVRRTIDIWSLGCVFSLAATWVVLGYEGIRQFSRFRDSAIRKIVEQRKSQATEGRIKPFVGGDFFHDGTDILPDVRDWHEFLRRYLRQTDTITSQVLSLVENHMLKGKAEERIEAKELCKKLKDILTRYQNPERPRPKLLGSIMQALLQVDEEAPPRPAASRKQVAQTPLNPTAAAFPDQKAGKSNQLDLPLMKTTHRSEYLRSALRTEGIEPEAASAGDDSNFDKRRLLAAPYQLQRTSTHGSNTTQKTDKKKHPMESTNGHANHRRTDSLMTNQSMAGSATPTEQHKRQNVWQARDDIRHNRSRWTGRIGKDDFLTGYFNNRDIKFLVDNAETMEDYWFEAQYLLETLVMKAKGQDKNGMDLSFTQGSVILEGSNDAAKFSKKMDERGAKPMKGWHTNLTLPLEKILAGYLAEFKRTKGIGDVKKLTLLVLTDGKWDGMDDKEDVARVIVDFAKEMEQLTQDALPKRERRVSIEFIQFGFDEDATARLRRLDDDLPYEGVPDIVDTEHSSGDLNKMLLGSFVEEFDKKDEMLSSPPLTPSRGNSYGISRPLPPPHLPLFPDLVQRTSPHAMPPRVDTVQPSTRTSHVTYGSDGTGRTPERVQTIPSIQYHGR